MTGPANLKKRRAVESSDNKSAAEIDFKVGFCILRKLDRQQCNNYP